MVGREERVGALPLATAIVYKVEHRTGEEVRETNTQPWEAEEPLFSSKRTSASYFEQAAVPRMLAKSSALRPLGNRPLQNPVERPPRQETVGSVC